MILLGTLTVSGFAPLDYTPPSVPIIKPTPSDALFYEIEDDPRGRWWLDHPVAANGDEDDLPFGIGTWCEPINVPTPLRVSVDEDMGGAPVGFTFALTVPIVRLDVAMLIESLIGGDVQLVPVTVIGCANQYRLLNILRSVQCLDLRRSDYTLKDGRKGPVPDAKVADLQYVRRAVIDRRRAGDHHLFRLDEGNQALIASRTMKTRLETALVSGIKFKPLESSFENER